MSTLYPARNKSLLLFLLLAFSLVLVELGITHVRQFTTNTLLPLAVTLDLLMGIPALYYFFIVRRYHLPTTTVAAVFLLCLYLASVILPVQQQLYLLQIKQIALLVEPILLVVGIFKIRRIVQEYKLAQSVRADFEENLVDSFRAVFGNSLLPLASEITMLRYGLFFWVKTPAASAQRAFSMHRESGFVALMSTLMVVSAIEMGVVHLLVDRWQHSVALVLLFLSLYSTLFLLAHLHAVRQRPVLLAGTKLVIRTGLIWQCEIDLCSVARLEIIPELGANRKEVLNMAKPLLTQPNLLLTCHEPVAVTGIYGLRKSTRALAFYLDQPKELLTLVQQQISACA